MRDGVTPTAAAAVGAASVRALLFVELQMAAGSIRVCNAAHSVDWAGETWQGAANCGRIEPIEEGLDQQMRGVAVELSFVPTPLIAQALAAEYFGRRLTVWFAPLGEDNQPLANPFIVFRGRMDTMPIAIGKTGTIKVTAESRNAGTRRPKIRRYTDEDQRLRNPADNALKFVARMTDMQLRWRFLG